MRVRHLLWLPALVAGAALGCEASELLGPQVQDDTEPAVRYRVRGLVFRAGIASTAHDLNDGGTIVGVEDGRAVRWLLDEDLRATESIVLELPSGGDPGPGEAMGVNNAGQVVGSFGSESPRPFLWTEAEGLRPLPLPDGAQAGVAYDINDDGFVVGSISTDPEFDDPDRGRLVRWTVDAGGEVTVLEIGAFDGTGARGHAINDQGQIAGIVYLDGGASQAAFVWDPVADLETEPLDGPTIGMNNRGAVVGSHEERAVMWRGGAVQTLGPRGSFARAVNDELVIVGEADLGGRAGRRDGFVIAGGVVRILETLSLAEYARPLAVNDAGIIVGDLFTEGPDISEAAYWTQR